MRLEDFVRNPPEKPEETFSTQGEEKKPVGDPGGSYVCIDGVLHFCYGGSCRQVPDPNNPGSPMAC
jgi:hypothetical protein